MSARAAILARVAAAQRTSFLPPAARNLGRPGANPCSADECLERFRTELTLLGVENHLELSAAEVRTRVAPHLEGRRVLSWDLRFLPYDVGSLLKDPVLGGSAREDQAAADIGLTGCDGAIAETGSLVLLSGRGKSRAVSLLPPVHLAVVRRQDLCFTMAEFFRASEARLSEAACCTVITGPSRTADIELQLTLGVHGPGRVIVVIGPNEPAR